MLFGKAPWCNDHAGPCGRDQRVASGSEQLISGSIPGVPEARTMIQISVELGGDHALEDNRNAAAQRGCTFFRGRTAPSTTTTRGHTNGHRRDQIAERGGYASLFQSIERRYSGTRDDQRVRSKRHFVPACRIDRGFGRWREKNAARR